MTIKKTINTFSSFSLMVKLELLFYPIFLLWRMPIAWVKSLWEARILLNGRWDRCEIKITDQFAHTRISNRHR